MNWRTIVFSQIPQPDKRPYRGPVESARMAERIGQSVWLELKSSRALFRDPNGILCLQDESPGLSALGISDAERHQFSISSEKEQPKREGETKITITTFQQYSITGILGDVEVVTSPRVEEASGFVGCVPHFKEFRRDLKITLLQPALRVLVPNPDWRDEYWEKVSLWGDSDRSIPAYQLKEWVAINQSTFALLDSTYQSDHPKSKSILVHGCMGYPTWHLEIGETHRQSYDYERLRRIEEVGEGGFEIP